VQHVNNALRRLGETIRASTSAEVLKESLAGTMEFFGRLEVDYEQPLDYREEVVVGCRVSRIGAVIRFEP